MPANLQRLIDYAMQFDPEFPKKIRGSSGRDIESLSAVVGRPLPEEYRAFLECFGEADGGLKIAFDGSTALADLADFYREYVQTGEVQLPPGCLAIGVDAMTGEAICLQSKPDGRPAGVVFTGETGLRGGYADSLEKLLYRTVTLKLRSPSLGNQKIFLGTSEDDFRKSVAVAHRLGYQPAWFSDSYVFCGEKPGELLSLIQYEGQPLSLTYACADAGAFEQCDEMVHREFGLQGNAVQES